MSYIRLLGRSHLFGDPDRWGLADMVVPPENSWQAATVDRPIQTLTLVGDLRRLEHDQRDSGHLKVYAKRAGITPEQARAVLDAFFESDF